jgi:hypothetical protein
MTMENRGVARADQVCTIYLGPGDRRLEAFHHFNRKILRSSNNVSHYSSPDKCCSADNPDPLDSIYAF